MTVREVLLLGNPQLYQTSKEIKKEEIELLKPAILDLHDTMMAFRQKWGGRTCDRCSSNRSDETVNLYAHRSTCSFYQSLF